MFAIMKRVVAGGCIIILFISVLSIIPFRLSSERMRILERIEKSDMNGTLNSCRKLIEQYQRQTQLSEWSSVEFFGDNIPAPIADLNPACVQVYRDRVAIFVSVQPAVFLLAFADGAEEYGEEELYDGLWWGRSQKKRDSRTNK